MEILGDISISCLTKAPVINRIFVYRAPLTQSVRAAAYELLVLGLSPLGVFAPIAQLAERLIFNQQVYGSSLYRANIYICIVCLYKLIL